jgi:hypothetical protein
LDNKLPYSEYWDTNTGVHNTYDNPNAALSALFDWYSYRFDASMYMMFRPDGPLSLTEWVPIAVANWSFFVAARATPAGWVLVPPARFSADTFGARTTLHPIWNTVHFNGPLIPD